MVIWRLSQYVCGFDNFISHGRTKCASCWWNDREQLQPPDLESWELLLKEPSAEKLKWQSNITIALPISLIDHNSSLCIISGALKFVSSDFLCIYCTLSEISGQLVGNALFIPSVKFLQGFQPTYLEYLFIYLLCTLQKKMCCHL